MATLNIFVSFEFDKDKKFRKEFYGEAKHRTNHKIRNGSLRESYPNDEWEQKAEDAIAECDVVIVLVGQDTHNAQGVIVESEIAHELNKPIFQIRRRKDNYRGLTRLSAPIPWRWKKVNEKLDSILENSGTPSG